MHIWTYLRFSKSIYISINLHTYIHTCVHSNVESERCREISLSRSVAWSIDSVDLPLNDFSYLSYTYTHTHTSPSPHTCQTIKILTRQNRKRNWSTGNTVLLNMSSAWLERSDRWQKTSFLLHCQIFLWLCTTF